ncbi:MAG: 3-hydroxyacyl-CoA dehydrogenase family protein [Planctomycetes bacterium]|nr:3-hydroxyacyl-CoA dehydrogenase family protein [Planctomycetota bacterium]NBY01926.1 3-hydroxyacyl-CoA dehydrogenase family protein [Planctomycetota bacterium]
MIRRIGIVGLGLLGRGITACFLEKGFEVVALTRNHEEHEFAFPIIGAMLSELVDRGVASSKILKLWKGNFKQVTDTNGLADCQFIIESVFEDLATKQKVFDDLEKVVPHDVVIASNTSAIPISVLQQSRKNPGRFVGMHWAEPAHATRFLELIQGEATSKQAMDTTIEVSKLLGKDPVVCMKDVPGFIVNRIAYAMYREALHLVETGVADFETIDRSLRNTLGLWAASCGPFRWIDLTGGPSLYAKAMQRIVPTLTNDSALPLPLEDLVKKDAHGIKNGVGFYNYTPEESRIWEDRQRRHTWAVKHWLDSEFPLK